MKQELLVEQICQTPPFLNGAEPSWSRGNSPIVRVGSRVFVTNMRVHPERKGLNRTSLELWERRDGECWRLVYEDTDVFQREPSPVVYLGDHRLVVTANVPARFHCADDETTDADCIPTLYVFDISGAVRKLYDIRIPWDRDDNTFWEHSYRGCAFDSRRRLLFLDNIDYGHDDRFCYSVLDSRFSCIKTGTVHFPERSCYHNIAMNDGETYVFAVQDIKEPNPVWRDYKFQMTGRTWDYDFRKIYMNYCPDIESGDFEPSVLICDRSDTCGWTTNLDCCFDTNGDMLLLLTAQNVYPAFMREKFFPDLAPSSTLEVYRFSRGKLVSRKLIDESSDRERSVNYHGFFHTAANGELYLLWEKAVSVPGDATPPGMYLTRVSALDAQPVRLLDETGWLYGSKTRLGASPSDTVDLYWPYQERSIRYTQFDLNDFR